MNKANDFKGTGRLSSINVVNLSICCGAQHFHNLQTYNLSLSKVGLKDQNKKIEYYFCLLKFVVKRDKINQNRK